MDLMPENAGEPDRERIAADAARIGALLRAVEAPAPARLQAAVAERYFGAGARRRRRARLAIPISLAGAAAAAVALALVLSASPAPPTVVQVSKLALARPTAAAPATLIAAGTRITFPDWAARGWPSAGARSDSLDGRTVTTLFYRSYDSGTIGYSIVSGAPVAWGAPGSRVTESGSQTRGGERYSLIGWDGRRLVTWLQDGHTCVLASRTASGAQLLALAEHATGV